MKKNKFLILVLIYLVGVIYVPVIGMDEFATDEDVLPIEPDLIPLESLPIIEPLIEIEEAISDELVEKGINESPYYYYYDNKKVNLTPNPKWLSYFTDNPEPMNEMTLQELNVNASIGEGDYRYIERFKLALVRVERPDVVEKIQKDYLQEKNGAQSKKPLPVFGSDEQLIVITDQLIVKLKPGFGLSGLEELNKEHNVEIVKKIEFLPDTYLLRVLENSGEDGLRTANLYYETGNFEYAEPNFMRMNERPEIKVGGAKKEFSVNGKAVVPFIPDDILFENQWHLHNTGQFGLKFDADIDAPEAWSMYRNPKIMRIAVIDDGVNHYHEDLSNVVVRGYSVGIPNGDGLPYYTDDNHGTPVAGLIAASFNNGIGVAGVCPSCRISSIWVDFNYGTTFQFAEAIRNAYITGDDIINCSWRLGAEASIIKDTIDLAVTQGRGGRGSVVIFSAGNHKKYSLESENQLVFPAKLDSVISVGATNGCDERKIKSSDRCNFYESCWSSHYGSGLDISAPGGWLWTTAREDKYYWTRFNGTSGAAPIVSGVAGLVLGKNPALRAKQVQYILERSADDIGPTGKDIYTGAGRVNAFKAVVSALQTKNRYYDFNGNGIPDIALFRPSNGTWYTYGSSSTPYGIAGDIPTAGDYNNDGLTEISVFRPSNGMWYFRGYSSIRFGQWGDIPVPADYNNDGGADIAVFRPSNGTWYVRNRGQIPYGMGGDIPVPADYDGDGFADIAVFRPSNGTWYIRNIGNLKYGQMGDIPVPTDYNGDGKADIAVFRPSSGTWHIRNIGTVSYGTMGDIPIPFDFDGNGASEITVYRPSNGTWYIRNRGQIKYGATGDIPVYRFAGHTTTIYANNAGKVDGITEKSSDSMATGTVEFFDPETMENGTVELVPIGYSGIEVDDKSKEEQEIDQEQMEGFQPLDMNEVNMPSVETLRINSPAIETRNGNPTLDSKQINLESGNFNQWYYIHRQDLVLPNTGFPTKYK